MHDPSTTGKVTRRNFLSTSGLVVGGAGLVSLSAYSGNAAEVWPQSRKPLVSKGDLVLFQGDSITDAGRNRNQGDVVNSQPALGNGYAWLASAELLVNRPVENIRIL